MAIVALWMPKRIGYTILCLIAIGNACFFANKYLYFSERRFVYPDTPVITALKKITSYDRFWSYENGYIENNFASFFGLFSPEGYDSIINHRYGELLAFATSHGASSNPDRANALLSSTDHISDILSDPYRKKLLQLLGIRYILQKRIPDKNEQSILPDPDELPVIWKDNIYAIHEYTGHYPRAFITTSAHLSSNDREMLTTMFDRKTDLRKTILVSQALPFPIDASATGSAVISAYTPNSVTIDATTSGHTMLFLSDTYNPGWNVYVNGIQQQVYRANYAFRSVPLRKGIHRVIFRYEPMSWNIGVFGSILGILFTVLLIRWLS